MVMNVDKQNKNTIMAHRTGGVQRMPKTVNFAKLRLGVTGGVPKTPSRTLGAHEKVRDARASDMDAKMSRPKEISAKNAKIREF